MINGYFGEDDEALLLSMERKNIYESLTLDNVEKFLISLGVQVDRYSDHLVCPTICHNPLEDAETMKLYYYQENKKFHCYTECNENMTIFELYKRYMKLNHYEIDDEEAENYIKRFIGEDIVFTKTESTKTNEGYERYRDKHNINKCAAYNENILSTFTPYHHPLWLREGIKPEVMDHFGISFCIGKNQIVIPQRDLWGDLIGIRRRGIEEEDLLTGKYKPLKIYGTEYTCHLGFTLYGIYEHQDAIRKYKKAIIYEGEKSVLLDEGFYGKDSVAVAICGSSLHLAQIALLTEILGVNEITLALDKEFINPYDKKGMAYRKKLVDLCKKYLPYAEFYYIFDEQNLLQEKDSPIDKGEEVFEKLYRKKIKVK